MTPISPIPSPPAAAPPPPSTWRRALTVLKPSHRHTAFTATLLLMISAFASRVIGLVRVKYIAYLFGAGVRTDAFNAAFQLPDMIAYFLVGGTASITFVTILSRYREQGQEREGERVLSIILTVMLCVLGAATLAAEFLAPVYVHTFFPHFNAEQMTLCIQMTRILLPAQLAFFAGGVFASVLLVHKQFAYQAVTPLIYNLAIILGGVFLAHRLGISSLAIGALSGAVLGVLLLNAVGAWRVGVRYRPLFDLRHPGLHEWIRLSIPLMLGVSLVTADNWIINYFASHAQGQISRLTYAKNLFTAPMAILGQAAGAASMPFFASLFSQGRLADFAASVNSSVSRILQLSLLLAAPMIGLAYPAVDLFFRGGSFHTRDARETATYFATFAVSLFLWSAQAIYARAFFATGNTVAPMTAAWCVTLVSLPIYWSLYRYAGGLGLAIASDCGITIQTVTLALMLHRRRIVPLNGLQAGEIGRAAVAALVSLLLLGGARALLPRAGRFQADALVLLAGSALWLAASAGMLRLTGSKLPGQLTGRLLRRRAS
jgi:putative peptidoglycan lipid II flippase